MWFWACFIASRACGIYSSVKVMYFLVRNAFPCAWVTLSNLIDAIPCLDRPSARSLRGFVSPIVESRSHGPEPARNIAHGNLDGRLGLGPGVELGFCGRQSVAPTLNRPCPRIISDSTMAGSVSDSESEA